MRWNEVVAFSLIVTVLLSSCSVALESNTMSESTSADNDPSWESTVSYSSVRDTEESITTESTEPELVIPEEYYIVIDSLIAYIDSYNTDNPGIPENYEYICSYEYDMNLVGMPEMQYYGNPLDLIGFSFVDIDNDNIAELVILGCEDGFLDNRILELYTYYDGEVHHLLSGWIRSSYYIMKDMSIYHEGSSGAAYSTIAWYNYDSIDHKLVFNESYYTVDTMLTNYQTEGILICHTYTEECWWSCDIDDPNIEVIGNYTNGCPLYEEYGADTSEMYVYDNIITLTNYVNEI